MHKPTLFTPPDVCTGCSACAQRCPSGAISMKPDDEGFVRASVAPELCIHCNLCNKVCPVGEGKEHTAREARAAYATWNSSLSDLQKSSSGGMFSLFAHRTLRRGGLVCGSVYDNLGVVHHELVEDECGLERMRGSKYVQSEMRDCFPRIRDALRKGRQVLFSGTGCQVAGLRAYLGREYENLFLLEIICEGTPSPAVLRRHLQQLCPDMAELHYLSFRDKAFGWTKTLVAEYTDKAGKRGRVAVPAAQDPYITAMFAAISQARNCYECKFRDGRAGADVTIGDMWALGVVAPEANPPCGASVLLVHSDKGAAAWAELQQLTAFCKEIAPLSAAINNGYLYRAPVIEPEARAAFYRNHIAGVPLAENTRQTLQKSNRIAILNHAGHCNYGSNLTAYALQEHLRRCGHDARIVSLRPFRCPYPESMEPFNAFMNTVMRWTCDCYGPSDCAGLNADFDTFIVGSDQVWRYPRPWIRRCAEPSFYLDFAAQGKRRVAYAASFGISRYEGPRHLVKRFYKALRDFDAVSVREAEGLEILRDRFDYTQAKVVLDPVFLLSAQDWQRFALASGVEVPANALSYMFFFDADWAGIHPALEACAGHLGGQLVPLGGGHLDVMAWLKTIASSRLIVTDSFHTVCFAIIFRRPFIAISSAARGKSRILGILQLLGMEKRLIDVDEVAADSNLAEQVLRLAKLSVYAAEYEPVLKRLIEESKEWLESALRKPAKRKKIVISYSHLCSWIERLPFRVFSLHQKLKQRVNRVNGLAVRILAKIKKMKNR